MITTILNKGLVIFSVSLLVLYFVAVHTVFAVVPAFQPDDFVLNELSEDFEKPGVFSFSYGTIQQVAGPDAGSAAHFSSNSFGRWSPLNFVPSGQNWDEGSVEFWIKPDYYPTDHSNIIVFNWNSYPLPDAGYVGSIRLTSQGKIYDNCGWEWGGGTPPEIISGSSIPVNQWSHVKIDWSRS